MKVRLALLLAVTMWSGPLSADETHSFWWYTKAKLACFPDVMRLCRNAMPDTAKVRDCMTNKRPVVSAGCAEFYPGGRNAD